MTPTRTRTSREVKSEVSVGSVFMCWQCVVCDALWRDEAAGGGGGEGRREKYTALKSYYQDCDEKLDEAKELQNDEEEG